MLFQLLFGYIRKFRHKPKFYAYLDERTTKHTPEKLRKMLNAKAWKEWRIDHRPYRVCQFRDSKAERLIQIADVLSGAIAYRWNSLDTRTDAAPQKVELMQHITERSGLVSLSLETPFDAKFNIWPIDLTGRSRAPRLFKPWR